MNFSKKKSKLIYLGLSIVLTMLLVFSFALSILGNNQVGEGAVITTSSADFISTDMLFSNRQSTTVGSKIFDGDVLDQLYAKLAGENATFTDIAEKARTRKDTYSNTDVKSIHSGMDSEDIRSANSSGKNIVVTLGGKEWVVVALTTKDVSQNSDVVLTLMMKDVSFNTKWGAWNTSTSNPNDFSPTYPATMYSTSYARAALLNGTTQYSSSNGASRSSLTDAEKTSMYGAAYPFEIFTNTTATGSITNFLVKPNEVLYQQYENLYDLKETYGYTVAPNDNAKYDIDSTKWHPNGTIAIQGKTNYYDWGNDLLWLPGLAETGEKSKSNGLWKLSEAQRSVSTKKYYWLRSGVMSSSSGGAFALNEVGTRKNFATDTTSVSASSDVLDGTMALRPAINLNLSSAEASAFRRLNVPQGISVTYNGNPQGADEQTWYTSSFASAVDVEYYVKDSQTPISKPTAANDYTIKLTINGNNVWADDNDGNVRYIDFSITKKEIEFPKFDDDIAKPYNGGGNVDFQVEYQEDYVNYYNISVPSGDKYANVTFNKNSFKVTAHDIEVYQLEVTLKDSSNTAWKTSNNKLEFTVTKATVNLSITDPSQNSALTGGVGEHLTVYIDIDQNTVIHNGKSLPITITASSSGLPTLPISDLITLTAQDRQVPVTLDLSDLRADRHYTLDVSTDSAEYLPNVTSSTTLDVTAAPDRTVLTWNVYCDGLLVRGHFVDADILQSQTDVTLSGNLPYNGKRYTFRVSEPMGYRLDTSFGVDGFLVTPSTNGNNNVGINADTYTTKIRLLDGDNNPTPEYSITWTIEPTKIDLSTVKWLYDGKLPYNGGAKVDAVIDPATLPEQLTATYGGSQGGTSVGGSDGSGTVTVTLAVKDEYKGNYVEPKQSDNDSYIGPFEWSKTWEIVPATIKLEWTDDDAQDEEENTFKVKKLSDASFDGIVEYVYYETDGNGVVKEPKTALTLDDIHVSATEAKFYVAEVSIKSGFENNYKFSDGATGSALYSPFFSVGGGSNAAQVSLAKSEYEYNNGKAIKLQLATIGVRESDLDLTYYSGDVVSDANKLNGAPTNVGSYLVVITAKSGSNVTLTGTTQYEFEITKAHLTTEWNENAKPYVLNLKYGQIKGVEYEIQDMDGNAITDMSQIKAGNSYKIKANIKDTVNYVFEDDTLTTDWQTFSVREGDKIYDPNDPINPNYPQVDPDDPTNPGGTTPSGDDGNGGGTLDDILAKLREIPLWQLIASVISIILIIIFLSKTAGYESKRKKFNKKADKIEKVYAGATFLGLAFSAWTAIACVLMAMAVVSFVIMLLAKSRANKAEENYEDCLEEYKRNEKSFDERRREEEYARRDDEYRRRREEDNMRRDEYDRRRDEDLQALLMRMFSGNMGGGNMGQGGYVVQQGVGIEDIRGIISETVTALLPGVQQALPQQVSSNDELVNRLIEQNEKLMEKLSEQQPVERIVEKEVAASSVNDETIKQMMKNQEMLMEKILELSVNQNETQIIEKVVQPQVQIIEKEVPVEKIVEKVVEVPVEVEKIVEKEVKVEVPVEVEKIVEKEVIKEVKVAAPSKPKKEVAPRLTLDEAYALLSKTQKKYFDGLKEYALSKPGAKEKKSTYAITIGQSTINPLLKLTIKKDMTVALFKMEDEYLKDIKRDASGDGTKIKVKETEVVISDAQACKAAKNMIDLREDQIERYNDLLKEQRAMKRK